MQTERVSENADFSWMKLLPIFYQKKRLILLTTLLGFIIGAAILFFSEPMYEAKIRLSSATEGEISELNQGRSWSNTFLKPKTARDVYFAYNSQLVSNSIKEEFFKQYYLPALTANQKANSSEAQLWASFSQHIFIMPLSKTAADKFAKYTVAIQGSNAKQVALWLQQFTDLLRVRTVNALLGDMKQQSTVVMRNLNLQMEIARNLAKTKRLDRITQLKEKVRMAQLASASRNNFWEDEPTVMDGPGEEIPLNMDEIQAELKSLSERKSDDAFAPGLRELQAKLELYRSLTVNPEHITVFNLDGVIDAPKEPIAPKKRLILMESLVLGFLAGIFMVMFQMAWRKELLSV